MTSDPSNAVVHLTFRRGKSELAVGSGVLYRRNNAYYIVTAWHNVTGRHSLSLKPLSKLAALPDNCVAYISCNFFYPDSQIGTMRRPFTIPLENADQSFYLVHPQGYPRVDVVAIPINLDHQYAAEYEDVTGKKINVSSPMRKKKSKSKNRFDVSCIQEFEEEASKLDIDFESDLNISDDLFIPGYPKGIIDMSGQPLWKRATVATHPHLGWNGQKQFLVDCASREGMSGAPAIVHSQRGALRTEDSVRTGNQMVSFLVGIYVGRLGQTSHFEAQIGTIWRRSVIDEIIGKQIVAPHSSKLTANSSEIQSVIIGCWPTKPVKGIKGDYASKILEGGSLIDYFTHNVMDILNGRADPDNVKEMILEFARSKTKV
jgi:hypothetical protein